MSTFDSIEQEILYILNNIPIKGKKEGWIKSDGKWTRNINNDMADLGHQHGYLVYARQGKCDNADGKEWLYDLHWRKEDENGHLINIALVMESEWRSNTEGIIYDFNKILQARANYKVMIFEGNDIEGIINKLINKGIKRYEGLQKGDRYFFAGWGWDTKKFHFKLYVTS